MPHILETYALTAGQKIDKPFIREQFFPLPTERYITLQPSSKFPSKCYDFFVDVVSILYPILNKAGISILQIGDVNDRAIPNCIQLQGKTSLQELFYVIKRGLLHCGTDSCANHFSSGAGKKIVGLYCNNFTDCVSPYWTKQEDMILLEPNREKFPLPSFAAEEYPKSINSILPEKIAESVCKLLNLLFDFPYKTVYTGQSYLNRMIEMCPDVPINISNLGIDQVIVRMDFLFNEDCLFKQLQLTKCSIITNKPINRSLLESCKNNVSQLVFELDDNHDIEFCKFVKSLGINLMLISYKDKNWIQDRKIDYCELGVINSKNKTKKQDISEIKDIKDLYYKTAKFTLSNGKIYPSKYAWLNNLPAPNFEMNVWPAPDCETLFNESENFVFLSKNDKQL